MRPVKLRDSLYLLIPVDIARLVGAASSSNFLLSLNEKEDSVQLVYEMKKTTDNGDPARSQEGE